MPEEEKRQAGQRVVSEEKSGLILALMD